MLRRIVTLSIATLALGAMVAEAQGRGDISGTVSRADGSGVGGVAVVVTETGAVEVTNADGAYSFLSLPAGSYTLTYTLGDNADNQTVDVTAGETAQADLEVGWDISFAETITVVSASRRRERVVDAPAAVTVISAEEIEEEASTGQLAKVLEFSPGVEVTQSGVYDFNLNTRGFNSSLNRRVQALVDGRSPSVPFLGSTEWGFLGNMQDLASVELVRGPSSALYGANAFNGVLNLVTKAPRDTQGGKVTLTAGELNTAKADVLWSTGLGGEWFLKLTGNYTDSDDYTRARIDLNGNGVGDPGEVEYPGLPLELAVPRDTYEAVQLGVRLDKHFADGSILTIEGGHYDADGGSIVTGIGRVNVDTVERPWYRFNYTREHFNFLAYRNERDSPNQSALASGGRIFLDTNNQQVEVQTNWDFAEGKVRLVGGASYREDEIDTANNQGIQTLVFAPVDSDFQAVYGQVDFDLAKRVKLVIAGRYDDSSLHDSQVSPKAAVVWGLDDKNTLRFSYNEAFQVANYSEFFLDAPTVLPGVGPVVDLRLIEAGLCAPFMVDCGFGTPTRVRALGNDDLELEEITSFEVGYSGILGGKAFLTVDYYRNELENFITDLLPNVFGTINPDFGPYTPPANHPAPGLLITNLQNALGAGFAFLSRNVDGTPIFALASYTNAGEVDTQGVDLGLNYYIDRQWLLDFGYSWFDFDVKSQLSGDALLPNAPENKFTIGITYNGGRWGGSLKYRWVDDFEWAAGAFAGTVESYSVLNLNGSYDVNERVTLGLNVSNLLDDEHYQTFGGDILERRALGSVTFNW